jgi:multidrug efflux pump subunit AcrA (membrane-fusion protein)
MQGSGLKVICYSLLIGAITVTLPVRGADNVIAPVQPLSTGEQPASSIPSREIELKFAQLGLIADVKVKDGDVVKKGQVLALQDTTVEQAALQREQYDLKSTVQKRAAEKQRDLSEVKWKRREALATTPDGSPGSVNKEEVEEARLQYEVDKLKVELAQEETEKKRLDIIKLQKQIDRMKIVAPYDGVIRKVENQIGSVSDPQKASIVFVVNDPVKIETKIPSHLAAGLKIGQQLQVRYIDEKQLREAKIVYFDPVADASVVGGMQLVHLEMPNPDNRRAGQEMAVKLPQNVAEAK